MTGRTNAETKRTVGVRLRTAALAAFLPALAAVLLSFPGFTQVQRGGHGGPPHAARPAAGGNHPPQRVPGAQPPRSNNRPGEPGGRNQQDAARSAYGNPHAGSGQPANPRSATNDGRNLAPSGQNGAPQLQGYPRFAAPPPRPEYPGGANGRPGGPGSLGPYAFPPGHLGSWLNQHRNLPLQGQEQLLHSDPSFNRLPQAQQQRLVQQLRQVDQMPLQQRERRLARAEAIEHMSPQQRTQLYQSNRELLALPADRQAQVKRAFRDLRGVPLDQRQTVINSKRYQSQFTPEERGILTNLLRAEPYEPPQP